VLVVGVGLGLDAGAEDVAALAIAAPPMAAPPMAAVVASLALMFRMHSP
jgi:hypothetical protein